VQETKARLANIFKMIGDKASTERGLVELWHFQRDHPETDINPHLARTSSQFRHYIQRGLSKVDRRMANSAGEYSCSMSSARSYCFLKHTRTMSLNTTVT
jgi:hypothetical protein